MLSPLAFLWQLPHDVALLLVDALAAIRASGKKPAPRGDKATGTNEFCGTLRKHTDQGTTRRLCARAERYHFPNLFRLLCPHCTSLSTDQGQVFSCANRHSAFRPYWIRLVKPALLLAGTAAVVFLALALRAPLDALPGLASSTPPSGTGEAGTASAELPGTDESAGEADTSALLTRARDLLANGRYATAKGVFLEAIRYQPRDVDLILEFAEAAGNANDQELAIDHLRQAVAIVPKRAICHYALAAALARTLSYEECLEHAAAATQTEPGNGRYRCLYAQSLLALGRIEEATVQARAAFESAPDDPECRLALANALLATGRYKEADEHFCTVLRDAPGEKRAVVGRARIHTFQRELDQADQILRDLATPFDSAATRLFSLSETHIPEYTGFGSVTRFSVPRFHVGAGYELQARVAEAQTEWAEACFALRQTDRAIVMLRELTETHPLLLTIRARLAQMLAQTGQTNQAYLVATKLLNDAPQDIGGHLVLATLFLRQGLNDKAREHATLALASQRRDLRLPTARQLLAQACVQQKDYASANAHFAALVRELPQLLQGHLQLSACQEASGRPEEARKTLENACAQFPSNSRPYTALGTLSLRQQQQDLAVDAFRNAIARQPPDPLAYNHLASILTDRDQTKEALKYATIAADMFPKHWGILDTLGWIHCRNGDTNAGLPYLNQALALAPGNPEIQFHLGYALAKIHELEAARWHLQIALRTDTPFAGIDEARALLASLTDH